jgi:hypothetical protein
MGVASANAEAMTELRTALNTWGRTATGLATQLSAAVTAHATNAEAEVRVRSSKTAAIEALLVTAKGEERARLVREAALASASLERARQALNLSNEAAQRSQRVQRQVEEAAGERVQRAAEALWRKRAALVDYESAPIPSASAAVGAGAPVAVNFGVPEIVDVLIEQADFADNPILDGFQRGGADISDYRWAVETWETTVRPGVLAGKTREDFARRDEELGQQSGFRRSAGVYDMFLGDDPVQFSRRADGRLDVASGRHRVAIARQLGLTHLPGRLHE